MDQRFIDSIKEELVLLSLVNKVEIENDDISFYVYIDGISFFTIYFHESAGDYTLISAHCSYTAGNQKKTFESIKGLIDRRIRGWI